jgi:hypothetical protein
MPVKGDDFARTETNVNRHPEGGGISAFLREVDDVFPNPGAENVHLRVTATGDTCSVYVNGSLIPAATPKDSKRLGVLFTLPLRTIPDCAPG